VPRLTLRLALPGVLLVSACLTLALTQTRLGSPLFLTLAAAMAAAQLWAVLIVRNRPATRDLLLVIFTVAIAARVPIVLGPVGFESDMVRYIWDGRVQRFGYNPYQVVPSDLALVHTHTADTLPMPSRHDRTPYPPAAQLFFRAAVTIGESPYVMKGALLLADLLGMVLVWRWLRWTGRNELLALAYGWSPLVILEAVHSAHLDALAAFWTIAAAYWLSRKRTALASVAFTLAVATKLLPVVLAPLFLGRVRRRDIALGAAVFAALYLWFTTGSIVPIGNVPSVVAGVRFNGPVFLTLRSLIWPAGAAVVALLAGFGAAVWARRTLSASDPAAWAWPMALSMACAPVVYPWYLLPITPFLLTRTTLPLSVWTVTVIPVYVVWERVRTGGRWRVPPELLVFEYGLVLLTVAFVFLAGARTLARRRPQPERQPTL
jgi:alpha-1,6-mannosyltransferase